MGFNNSAEGLQREIYSLNIIDRISGKIRPLQKGNQSIPASFGGGLKFELGSGKKIHFSIDIQVADCSLATLYPTLFGLALDPQCTIASQFNCRRNKWSIRFWISLSEVLTSELASLTFSLPRSLGSTPNRASRRLSSNGCYTVASFYSFLVSGGRLCPFASNIQKVMSPQKTRIFIWLALKDRILTLRNL